MQDEDIKLLRRIVAGGGRKYTAGNVDRSRYDRLVDLGWLTQRRFILGTIRQQRESEPSIINEKTIADFVRPLLPHLDRAGGSPARHEKAATGLRSATAFQKGGRDMRANVAASNEEKVRTLRSLARF